MSMRGRDVEVELKLSANSGELKNLKADVSRVIKDIDSAAKFGIEADTSGITRALKDIEKLITKINSQVDHLNDGLSKAGAKRPNSWESSQIYGRNNQRIEAENLRRVLLGKQNGGTGGLGIGAAGKALLSSGDSQAIAAFEKEIQKRLNLMQGKLARIDKGQIFKGDPLRQNIARQQYDAELKAFEKFLRDKEAMAEKARQTELKNTAKQRAAIEKEVAKGEKEAARQRAMDNRITSSARKQTDALLKHAMKVGETGEIADLIKKYTTGNRGRNIFNANEIRSDRTRLAALRGLNEDALLALGIDPIAFRAGHKEAYFSASDQSRTLAKNPWLQTSKFGQWYAQSSGMLGDKPGFGQRFLAGAVTPFVPSYMRQVYGGMPPPGSGMGGRGGGGGGPFKPWHHLNNMTTNVAGLGGMSLYGLGTIGAGGMFMKGIVSAAAEAQSLKIVLGGVVNTYARFRDVGGELVSESENLTKSMQYASVIYKRVREKAVESPLTTQQMFQYYMAGAPMLMSKGLNDKQALSVVDFMGTLGTAMNLAPRDVEQDIRATVMGDIRSTNKIGKMMGFTGPDIKAAFDEGGPEGFMKLFNAKSKNMQAALDEFSNSFVAKWSAMIDQLQQSGIALGEALLPELIKFATSTAAVVDEWIKSGRAAAFAESLKNVTSSVLGVFGNFVNFLGKYVNNIESILMLGFMAVLGRFVMGIAAQSVALSGATGAFLGVLGMLIAGLYMYINQAKSASDQAYKQSDSLFSNAPNKGDVSATVASNRDKYISARRGGKQFGTPGSAEYMKNLQTAREWNSVRSLAKDLGVNPDRLEYNLHSNNPLTGEFWNVSERAMNAPELGKFAKSLPAGKLSTQNMNSLVADPDVSRKFRNFKNMIDKMGGDSSTYFRLNSGKLEHFAGATLKAEEARLTQQFSKKGLRGAQLNKAVLDAMEKAGMPEYGYGGATDTPKGGGGGAYTPTTSIYDVQRAEANLRLAGLSNQLDLTPEYLRSGLLNQIKGTKNTIALADRNDAYTKASRLKGTDQERAIQIAQHEYAKALLENAAEYKRGMISIRELNIANAHAIRESRTKLNLETLSGRYESAKFGLGFQSSVFGNGYASLSTSMYNIDKQKLDTTFNNDIAGITADKEKLMREAMDAAGGNPVVAMMMLANNSELAKLNIDEQTRRQAYNSDVAGLRRGFSNGRGDWVRYNAERAFSNSAFNFDQSQNRIGVGGMQLDTLLARQGGESLIRSAEQGVEDTREKYKGFLNSNSWMAASIGAIALQAAQKSAQDQVAAGNILIKRSAALANAFELLEDSVKTSADRLVQNSRDNLASRVTQFFESPRASRVGSYQNYITEGIRNAEIGVDSQINQMRQAEQMAIAANPAMVAKPESYWAMLKANMLQSRYSELGSGLNKRTLNQARMADLGTGGIASFLTGVASGGKPGQTLLDSFAGFGEYGTNAIQTSLVNNLQTIVALRGKSNMMIPGFGMMPFGQMSKNAWSNIRNAGYQMLSQYAGTYLGQALGGSAEGSALGSSIGGGIAMLANANPWTAAAITIGGGLLGGLFGKKKKRDPNEEAHRKKLVELLSRIDKSLRPQEDYFRTIKGEALFGSSSRFYSGRNYSRLGIQVALGQ